MYWLCSTCRGRVEVTEPRPVPLCVTCGGVPLYGVPTQGGGVEWVQPAPSHCAEPARHRLLPGLMKVEFRSCRCRDRGRGHTVWVCLQCTPWSEQLAPACTDPLAGPRP